LAAKTDLTGPVRIKSFDADGRLDQAATGLYVSAFTKISDKTVELFIMNGVVTFFNKKWPYFIGFGVVEGLMYCFKGATGNFSTAFPIFFIGWLYYSWIARY
jgi:hypothetical protein